MINLTNNAAAKRAQARLFELAAKHQAHHVRRLARGIYEITSGRTGRTYRVDLAAMSCNCAAGKSGRLCDHRIAALTVSRAMSAPPPVVVRRVAGIPLYAGDRLDVKGKNLILNGITI